MGIDPDVIPELQRIEGKADDAAAKATTATSTAGTLAQSLGIGLPDEERDRLQETLERIDELERLADTKAGLVQLH